jgi:hypothetical protein
MENLVLLVFAFAIGLNLIAAGAAVFVGYRVAKPHKYWAFAVIALLWFFLNGPTALAFLFGFAPM